jgi:hypothetical protein
LGSVVLGHGQSPALAAPADSVVEQAVLSQFHVGKFTRQDLEPVGRSGELEIRLRLAGQPYQLVLQRHSLRAPGFRVAVQERDGTFRDVPVPAAQTYRGYVAGCGGSRVSASITDGGIRAWVCLGEVKDSTWVIEPLSTVLAGAAAEQHVVYSSLDLVGEAGVCGNQEVPGAKAPRATPLDSASGNLDVRVCRVACDADYEYFTLNGSSVSNTIADIETILNGVSAIYERDARVAFQLTQILVRAAEPDPYTATTVYPLLSEFRLDWRNNHPDIPRDLAHLFTGKNFGSVLGVSYTDQVCPAFDHYSVVRSRWQTDLGKRIALSAHELGHSFDAVHCDYDADPRCRIMCPSIGGCSVGYYSFEDSNIARIRATATSAACLTAGTVTTPTTTLPFADNFNQVSPLPNPSKWTAVDLAQCQYQRLEISVGRGYSSNQRLGTVRTLPMPLSGAALVRYRVNCGSLTSGQWLRIEYLNSSSFTWQPLRTVAADGANQYRSYEDAVPASAAGAYFAVRFSAWATATSSSLTWSLDDVSIVPIAGAPSLSIARTATNTVVLTWPQPAPGWTLEASAVLTAGAGGWSALAPPYPTNATHCVVTEPLPSGHQFYRLRTP